MGKPQTLQGDSALDPRDASPAMGSLFAIALLYLISRWLLSFKSRQSTPVISNPEGQLQGKLVHRYIRIEKTLRGVATDVTFHYVESANSNLKDLTREYVVFLHGFMDTWQLWQHALNTLADRYHVIALDLKGCGQSSMNYPQTLFPDVNDVGGDYTLKRQAEEIITALVTLGIEKFNLVTLDLGTIIGDRLAGDYCDLILHYIRCQQPLVGHFRGAIPQGQLLRKKRSAKRLTALLEADASSLVRVLYGRTGWPILDQHMKRTRHPLSSSVLAASTAAAAHPFQLGPRQGKPGTFACAWAGLYQHNRDYLKFLQENIRAYQRYTFPVTLVQGIYDRAMPPNRFDGTTGMAIKTVQPGKIRSRPFYTDGRGLGDGYEPWKDLFPGYTRPLQVHEFFPRSPAVQLKFMETGHFIPLEAPEVFTALLENILEKTA